MLEVFLTVSLAYALKRLGLFSQEHSRVLVNYVLYFPLPLLSFKTFYHLGFSKDVLLVGAGAWLVIGFCVGISLVVGKILGLDSANLRSFVMASSFGNTAFLGYPYSFAYFGKEGLSYAVVYDSVGSFLAVSSLGFFIVSGSLNLRGVVFFPPFMGLLGGLLLRGYELPQVVWKLVDFSVASLLPVVLFSLGLSLEFSSLQKQVRLVLFAMGIKMVLSPLFAFLVLRLLPLSEIAYKVSVIESAMPTMLTASALVLKFGLNHQLAFASAGLGTVLSFVSVPLWVYLLS